MNIPRTRIYVDSDLSGKIEVEKSNYLKNVLRLSKGYKIRVFNERNGEFIAKIIEINKKTVTIEIQEKHKDYEGSSNISLFFAPIKSNTSSIITKATELGVSNIQPIITEFTVRPSKTEKYNLYAEQAACQSERLDIPKILEPIKFDEALEMLKDYLVIFCDERGNGQHPKSLDGKQGNPAILIGPEGGFSNNEFEKIKNLPYLSIINLGPRVLKSETAVLSAITATQIFLGDWEKKVRFNG